MSVFNDFQRLWMQRFPQSSLSDAWEQDVRASLERHKIKIAEITKELEQETLYVEYLERLLSDVESFRESGGDPTALFESSVSSDNAIAPQAQLKQMTISAAAAAAAGGGDDSESEASTAGAFYGSDTVSRTSTIFIIGI